MWGPDKAKGKLDELKGKAKQTVGMLTDNDHDRVEGGDEAFHGRAEQAATEGRDDLDNATQARGARSQQT